MKPTDCINNRLRALKGFTINLIQIKSYGTIYPKC
jgi:hypothetical protein